MELLEHSEFIQKYFQIWESCEHEFFKFEMLPEYDEFGIADWSQVNSLETNFLINKIQSELFDWKDRYGKKIYTDKVEFLRVRYLPFPLTKYLLIELSSYMTSQEIGAKIEILEDADLKKIEEQRMQYFGDFLLFDNKHLFKLDNPNGITKCNAYYTNKVEEIEPYITLKNKLKTLSQPLDKYLKLLNLKFINNLPNGERP